MAVAVTQEPKYPEALVAEIDAVYGGDEEEVLLVEGRGDEDEVLVVEGRDTFLLDTLDDDALLDEIYNHTNITMKGGRC